MKVEFWGTRGSYPVPGNLTTRYGGNTTCVTVSKEVDGQIVRIVGDCGTGGILAGRAIVANYFKKIEGLNICMLFTHLHPDHTQGFPFFAPNFFPQCKMHLMGMKTLKKHIGTVLEQEMLPPTFPIEYKDLKSTRNHYEVKDGQIFYVEKDCSPSNTKTANSVFEIKVMQSYAPSHPQQGAVYYRITDIETGKSIAFVWDLESHYGGDRRVISFAKDCDLMIHDTQYTEDEYNSEKMIVQGFGHSTYEMAIENATQAGIKRLACIHYNPSHSDEFLDKFSSEIKAKNPDLEIIFSHEGMSVEV